MRRRVARYAETSESSSDLPPEIQSVDRDTSGSDGDSSNNGSNNNSDGTEENPTVLASLQNAVYASWFNLLLVFVPMGYLAHYLEWPVVAVFVLNYLAIIPLSALMGFATEEVSLRLGTTWGGVVNAVFGNIVELIVAVIALIEEEYRIVQAGLIGSVLSNTLLVLGLVFTAGGLRHRVQLFHAEAAQCAGALLALSVLSMIIPAAYHGVHAEGGEITNGILVMSRGTALILLLVYILFLVFQLKTHSEIFDGTHAGDMLSKEEEQSEELGRHNLGLSRTLTSSHSRDVVLWTSRVYDAGDSAQKNVRHKRRRPSSCQLRRSAPMMKLWVAAALLIAVSAMVALSSDILVDSVEELTTRYAISHTFVGMILLPLAANAAEHAMSMTVAVRDKMDLCITVAVGSSMQIALFVLPVLIIIAWIMNRPLTLFFDDFETTTMLISVLVINYLIMNGRSNWLKGAMLLSSYLIVALAFFLYPYDVDNPRATVSTSSSRAGIL
ncbi:hypothetical protein H4R20_004978 [Coemansia guatemalensis]|uniref:Sodium/calcium exchanger membrane region domain-containing protein n=1 Tax=Coemansia guatemalensis TaxID=2761395 RepID=A0A9W8LRK0_9FUNG|nr:hypothetical protein H4R20_004978 [Coemansia guatemalensis]